jgi:hypothetical protein
MKGNRVCIMAWAQEIDHSISSASYHVAMHLPAFAFTGAYPERGNRAFISRKLSPKVFAIS